MNWLTIIAFSLLGCPIRKPTSIRLLAAKRSLSQLAASFIASWHQGIHHKPFLAWLQLQSNCPPFRWALIKINLCADFKEHSWTCRPVKWWAWLDSNQWPCAYQAHALTNWATGPQPKWSWGELNSWPIACKATALPTELQPRLVRMFKEQVW